MNRHLTIPLIAQALMVQWRSIVASLPPDLKALMACPQFDISPTLSDWGQWRGGKIQCIALKADLFTRHPWYAVTDVLSHEMAHQLSDAIRQSKGLPFDDEPPHGPRFQRCCIYFNARPDASGNFPTLDELVYRDDDDTAEAEGALSESARLVVKVRKLLALSESSNQAEAEAALLKAREITAKYDLEEALGEKNSGDEQRYYSIHIGQTHRRVSIEFSRIAAILNEFFNVACVWDWIPDTENPSKPLRILSINGHKKDLQIASYTYDCILNYMKNAEYQLPSNLMVKVLNSKTARRDFHYGILTGFENSLREQHQTPQMRALVVAQRAKLDEYLCCAFPNLRSRACRTTMVDRELLSAGEREGRRMHLSPGIPQPDSHPKHRQLKA